MNPRRLIYSGAAIIGLAGLSAFAYYAQRTTVAPVEKAEAAASSGPSAKSAAPASNGAAGSKAEGGARPTVDVVKVATAKLVDDVNATGTLRSNESVVIRPEVSGRITQLNFRDGQPVRKGQVLVAFDATVNQAEVQQAKAELGIARANFNRNADLARQKFISERARDESEANVRVLEAKLALAEARLSKLEIRAPFSGVVGIRNISVGDYVKDGAELVNLEDISSVKVDFRIPERYAERAQPGQTMEVMVDALPGKVFKAKVDAIDPQVDSSGRSALLRGRIANQELKLKPGMFARVRLILAERENALLVPEEALVPQGNRTMVWRVADGKASRAEVKTGSRQAAQVEIVSGLNPGDLVVTAGQLRLSRDGTPVQTGQPESGLANDRPREGAAAEAKPAGAPAAAKL